MNVSKILVPVDFSPSSKRLIEEALTLSAALKVEIELVHVWDGDERVLPELDLRTDGSRSAEKLLREVRSHGERLEAAAAFLEEIEKAGIDVVAHMLRGKPAERIVDFAAERGFGLIVMGTHGRTGLNRLVLGSVAEAVVRTSRVPVLTVRRPEEILSYASVC
jgi:universal stress protein A